MSNVDDVSRIGLLKSVGNLQTLMPHLFWDDNVVDDVIESNLSILE